MYQLYILNIINKLLIIASITIACNPALATESGDFGKVGWGPLHIHAFAGRADRVEDLLKQGYDVNSRISARRELARLKEVNRAATEEAARELAGKLKPLLSCAETTLKHIEKNYRHKYSDKKCWEKDYKNQNKLTRFGEKYRENLRAFNNMLTAIIYEGATPLHVAISNEHTAVAIVLLDGGANINAETTKLRMRPIDLAAFINNERMIDLLIKSGASIDHRSNKGMTTLHWAAAMNSFGAASILLREGAVVNAARDDGATAMDLAQGNRRILLYNLLKAHKGKCVLTCGSKPKMRRIR